VTVAVVAMARALLGALRLHTRVRPDAGTLAVANAIDATRCTGRLEGESAAALREIKVGFPNGLLIAVVWNGRASTGATTNANISTFSGQASVESRAGVVIRAGLADFTS